MRLRVVLIFAVLASCGPLAGGEQRPLAGGETTTSDRTSSAFENPASNLDASELELHWEGDSAFSASFVTPPAVLNAGLGPLFNNTACSGCHVRNGRGLPVAGTGSQRSQLIVQLSHPNGEPPLPGAPPAVPRLGSQLQDHATLSAEPEGRVEIEWIEEPGTYPSDGAPYSLRRPRLRVTLADGSALPPGTMMSARIPPPVFGLGLLEAVPESVLEALADPSDEDGDGISGRVNRVWDVASGAMVVGRFGWRANQPSLQQQAAVAYFEDMGVTTPLFPDADGRAEVDAARLRAATFYTQTLAIPQRSSMDTIDMALGEDLFRDAGCAGCHVEELSTGDHAIESLRNQIIHPYTDLLLHHMGFDLDDGRGEFDASSAEWRTPALWGIGLTERVLGAAAFLHDGRARSLEEAILWHGGEALASRDAFRSMSATERGALLAFLGSL